DAVEHVFEEGLRPKADADADDAGGGEQRGEVDAQNVENVEQNDEADDCVGGGAQDGGDGADFGGALGVLDVRVRDAAHAVDEETDDAYEDEGDGQDDQHLREVFVDEGEPVAVPVVDDIGEGGVVLHKECEKEHDDDASGYSRGSGFGLRISISRSGWLDAENWVSFIHKDLPQMLVIL